MSNFWKEKECDEKKIVDSMVEEMRIEIAKVISNNYLMTVESIAVNQEKYKAYKAECLKVMEKLT